MFLMLGIDELKHRLEQLENSVKSLAEHVKKLENMLQALIAMMIVHMDDPENTYLDVVDRLRLNGYTELSDIIEDIYEKVRP